MISKKMMGTMAVLGMMLAGGAETIVNAQTRTAPSEEAIQVTYDNRNVLPDSNAQYGMVIPTALSFTDDSQTADASLEIVGIGGYDIDNDWQELEINVKVSSKNGFKLKKDVQEVNYKLTVGTDEFTSGTEEKTITKKFGKGNNTVKKETGTAELVGKAKEKGQYTDTLTYKFEETKNTRV
ncbi:hypothetical protein [Enterococcus durans]|uniref:hypothetical protein n=1 Tax=Enterococcus durans TaxID=53345 RepID=UPI000CF06C02|nr:hypothetical protein [Enterococcus durans]PQD35745.1 hypothetical protein CUM72_10585 [Enterococcus durans]